MLSINQIPLCVPDWGSESDDYSSSGDMISRNQYMGISKYIEQNINPSDLYVPFQSRGWPGFGLQGITYPNATQMLPSVKLGHFTWPRGASRWAYGHFIATANQIANFQSDVWGEDGSENNTASLYLDCAGQQSQENIKTDVYLLPPYPLFWSGPNSQGFNNLYIITCVDVRYYWQYVPLPDLLLTTSGSQTWMDIINTMVGALPGDPTPTINIDSIDADYLYPSIMLNLTGECLPPVLDAALYNVGQKLVRKWNGDLVTQNFSTAQSANQKDSMNNTKRTVRAGGYLFQNL